MRACTHSGSLAAAARVTTRGRPTSTQPPPLAYHWPAVPSSPAGETGILADGLFWIELLLVTGFGIFWFYRLTVCLGMYDPLFIIPLMQACFIVFGAIAGGIFFHEFAEVGKPGRLAGG